MVFDSGPSSVLPVRFPNGNIIAGGGVVGLGGVGLGGPVGLGTMIAAGLRRGDSGRRFGPVEIELPA